MFAKPVWPLVSLRWLQYYKSDSKAHNTTVCPVTFLKYPKFVQETRDLGNTNLMMPR